MITLVVVLSLIGLAVFYLSRKLSKANDKKLQRAFTSYKTPVVSNSPPLPSYSSRSVGSMPSKPASYSSSSSSSSSSYTPSYSGGSSDSGSGYGGGDSGGGGSSSSW